MTGTYLAIGALCATALAITAWRESRAELRRQQARMYAGRQTVTETWSRTETWDRPLNPADVPVTDDEWRAAFERLVGPEEAT